MHRTALRLEAGAAVRSGGGDLRLHLGAGSEWKGAPIVWGWTGRLGLGGGGKVALHFLASYAASRLPLNFPSCSQGRGGDVSAPCKGRKFRPEPASFRFPAGSYRTQSHGRDPAFLQKTLGVLERAPRSPRSFCVPPLSVAGPEAHNGAGGGYGLPAVSPSPDYPSGWDRW